MWTQNFDSDHAACTISIKETPAHSCFPVNSAESLRASFFRTLLGKCFKIFKSNKYMKVSFALIALSQKKKKKFEVALNLEILDLSCSEVAVLLS